MQASGKGYRWADGALVLDIKVQPRASRDEIVGLHGGRLKIRITASPVEGKANRHLLAFLARCFRVPKSHVVLVSGASCRDKQVRITAPARMPHPLSAATGREVDHPPKSA